MVEANVSLTELTGLSKPMCKLIDAVRAGTGLVYEPLHVRRMAKAEAAAAVIKAKGEAEAGDIAARAKDRLLNREIRRQKNVEAVIGKAESHLPVEVTETEVDEDWTAAFFEHCQDIKDEEMQTLWAKILAGEVTHPGSYSLRTLALVKVLSKPDAHLFTRLCACLWSIANQLVPIVYQSGAMDSAVGLDFEELTHLDVLGLITFRDFGYSVTFNAPNETRTQIGVAYYGFSYILHLPEGHKDLDVGKVLLSSIGKELAPIAGGTPDHNYREGVLDVWRGKRIDIETPSAPANVKPF